MIDFIKTAGYLAYNFSKWTLHKKNRVIDSRWNIHLKEVREKGISVVKNYYSKEKCEQMRTEIEALLVQYSGKIWVDKDQSDHRIFGADRISAVIKIFGTDAVLHSLAETYQACEIQNMFVLAARLKAKEQNLGSGGGWHRDSAHNPEFKAILYITDTDEFNGPFQYIPNSHSVSSLFSVLLNSGVKFNQHRFEHEHILRIAEKNHFQIMTATGKAGTLILADTRGLHRGMPIREGMRYALTNYYTPSFLYKKNISSMQKLLVA